MRRAAGGAPAAAHDELDYVGENDITCVTVADFPDSSPGRSSSVSAPAATDGELDNIGDDGIVCVMFPGTLNSSLERSPSVEISFRGSGGDDDASALGGGPLRVEFFRQVGVLLGS